LLIFRLTPRGLIRLRLDATRSWRNRTAAPEGPALSSIVVLPFLDFSPQKNQEYFSDGLTEEIIDGLSRVGNPGDAERDSGMNPNTIPG